MDRESLILQIMREAEKDGEPLTRAEAESVADLTIKANKNCKNVARAKIPSKKRTRVKKIDKEKADIISLIQSALLESGYSATIKNEDREIIFGNYSVVLTKHKGG